MGGEEGLMRRLVTESSDAGFATRTRGFDGKCESMNDEKLAGGGGQSYTGAATVYANLSSFLRVEDEPCSRSDRGKSGSSTLKSARSQRAEERSGVHAYFGALKKLGTSRQETG